MSTILFVDSGLSRSKEQMPVKGLQQLITGNSEMAIEAISELSQFDSDDLLYWIREFEEFPKAKNKGKIIAAEHFINDSLTAPYLVYVPKNYKRDRPSALVLWLHGGVGRKTFITADTSYSAIEHFSKYEVLSICEEEGWITIFPMARFDCLWWNENGMNFIDWLIRDTKSRYNIDDNKIAMAGFSDGASGAFYFAFLNATDYSVFFPWSGHIGVGGSASNTQVYVPNLTSRPLFAVNGGKDGLYPAEKMLPLMQLAVDQDVELYFTSYDTATHNSGYLSVELPLFRDRVNDFPRKPYPEKIIYECDNLKFGRIDWLEITAIDTAMEPAEWYNDVNIKLEDDRISIGFYSDREFEGEGIRVSKLVEDSTSVAFQMGLKDGDIVIALDDITLKDFSDLNRAKSTKKRGDPINITVLRNNEEIILSGALPPVAEYEAFNRKLKSGAINATRVGNTFNIRTSRITDFSLFVNPEMVRFDQPIKVNVNGSLLYNGLIESDSKLLLTEFIKRKDRKQLWTGRIDVKL